MKPTTIDFGKIERLCRTVAPIDLAGVPLYIVPQSRIPAQFGGKSVCDGFTTPSLDLYLRDVIGPAWQGRGPCMVINDLPDSDEKHVDHDVEQPDPDYLELDLCRTALHELAHILERPKLYRDRKEVEPQRIIFESLVISHAVSNEKVDEPTVPPFQGHEADFIRIALHLRHRADMAGMLVPLYNFCAGRLYGLSHANRYREALGTHHTEVTAPLLARLQGIRDTMSAAESARRRLWDTCTDRALLARRAEINDMLTEAHKKASEIRDELQSCRERAKSDRADVEWAKRADRDRKQIEELQNRAMQNESKAKDLESDLAKVEKRIGKLERDEREVRELMLEP